VNPIGHVEALMIILAEDFTGLGELIVLVHAALAALAVVGIVLSANRRWFGMVLAAPGMLVSLVTTMGFLSAVGSQNNVQWSVLPFFLFPAPLVLGIVCISVFVARQGGKAE
jgi:hypothetical protein